MGSPSAFTLRRLAVRFLLLKNEVCRCGAFPVADGVFHVGSQGVHAWLQVLEIEHAGVEAKRKIVNLFATVSLRIPRL
jgi:hypothetical protein